MSDAADPDVPTVTQDVPSSDVFSSSSAPPPPYPDPGQEPPPYSAAAPEMYPPAKAEATCGSEPGVGCESLGNVEVLTGEATELNPFDDKTVRRAFVRKVFCILTVQLLFTFTVVCVFTFSSVVKKAVQKHLWAYISSFIIFAVVAITLSCCQSFSRRHPWNIVGLAVVTLSLSYVVGTVASFHDTTAVVITMASTLAISLAIIAYSVQTRFQFDICYLLLLVLVVDLFMFCVYSTFYYTHILDVVYGSLGALLFSLFLMIDSQMIMDRVNPEEYVSAALVMYLDIVLIFLYLLGRR